MNLLSAEAALESKTQLCAVHVTSSLYKEIIIPALKNANSVDRGRGYFELPKDCMQVGFHADPSSCRYDLDWCWNVFDMLSFGPLVSTKKSRTISVSNLGSISESISMTRRMLLVQSPNNARYVYHLNRQFLAQLLETGEVQSADDYMSLSLEDQLKVASSMYRNLISIIVAIHPRTVETQVNIVGTNASLVIWGGFKSKAVNKK